MILKLNHLQGKGAGATAQDVIGALYSLLEEGQIEKDQFARLQVELDWIQYKQNFREVVIATQACNAQGQPVKIMDVRVDARQVAPATLRADILRAVARANPDRLLDAPQGTAQDTAQEEPDRLPLEEFQSMRTSIVWEFNKLYWTRLKDWEQATGRSYEQALPGGQSDGHQPQAIADSVGDFWTLLRDLDAKKQLPAEIFVLEIGVGTGIRCGLWLTKFRELDRQCGTNYYPKLRVLLGGERSARRGAGLGGGRPNSSRARGGRGRDHEFAAAPVEPLGGDLGILETHRCHPPSVRSARRRRIISSLPS
jgi:hypothetical protein